MHGAAVAAGAAGHEDIERRAECSEASARRASAPDEDVAVAGAAALSIAREGLDRDARAEGDGQGHKAVLLLGQRASAGVGLGD